MKQKLHGVLLVDNDDECNFFHQRLLNKIDCTEHVQIARNGKLALEFLTSQISGGSPCPEIIFLDINMPKMSGWEFLDEYGKLDPTARQNMALVILTTSLNPDDKVRALNNSDVRRFNNKYLTRDSLVEILTELFPVRQWG